MKLIFLHIPKAGGTTFHTILQRFYAKDEIFDIRIVDQKPTTQEFILLSADQKTKLKLLKGHMSFGLHAYFPGSEFKYVTFLRDPVSRVISLYNYIQRRPDHYLYDKVIGKKMSLAEFVSSDLTTELDNDQVRLISGKSDVPMNKCTKDLLELAKQNITEHFIACGITERFDESLILLKHKFGWKEEPYYMEMNVTRQEKKEDLSKVKAEIAKRNVLDIELYDWAKERFEASLREIPGYENEVKQLQRANAIYSDGYTTGNAAGYNKGYNTGYNYVIDKFFFLKIGKKIKSVFVRDKKGS